MLENMNSYLVDFKRVIDDEIEKNLQNDDPLIDALYKSASYSAGGGKRFRAVFALLVGRLFDVPEEKIISPACALELVHTASLIMDDLPYMAESQLRRGKPANHIVFGQDVALLASVGLISKGMEIILTEESLTIEERTYAATILARAFGFNGLAAGQFVDLKIRRKVSDPEICKFISQKKTAALFTVAGTTSAMLGKADEKQSMAIQNFSENMGFAFQIVDELSDIEGNEAFSGHRLESDEMNYVKLVGPEEARRALNEYYNKAMQELEIFGEKADELKAFGKYLIDRTS